MAKTLGSVAEGSIVYLNESGSPVAFYVAKHDYESALNGAGRTLLVRQNLYAKMAWDADRVNAYAGSDVDIWLTGTWLKMLDSFVIAAAEETTFYSTLGNGDATVTTLSRAAFMLSLKELGRTHSTANAEGTALPIASTLQIAYLDGAATSQWTRSVYNSNTYFAMYLGANGVASFSNANSATLAAVRPCITLPAEMGVDGSNNVTEPTTQILHGAMINNVLCVTKKCYAMIDGVLCAVPYGLANIDGVMTKTQFEE